MSLRVLVASSRHQVQWDLLEGNLVLTPPLVRFIGRKSDAHRSKRRQRNRLEKGQGPTQTLVLWNNRARMLGTLLP